MNPRFSKGDYVTWLVSDPWCYVYDNVGKYFLSGPRRNKVSTRVTLLPMPMLMSILTLLLHAPAELHLGLQVRQPVKHPTVFEAFLCKRPSNQRFVCISTRFGGLTWYEIVWIITKHRPTLHRHTDPIELKALDAARSVKLPICNPIKNKQAK